MTLDNDRSTLSRYLDEMAISLDDTQVDLLLKHLDLVLDRNKITNLTRIVDSPDTLALHVCDSLVFNHPSLDLGISSESRVLDIGTGAGYPGVPLALTTEGTYCLIDSVGKKVNAVNSFIDALGISNRATALQVRAEDLALQEPESFTHVVARAVAELRVLIEYAAPLLKPNSLLVVSKSHVSDEENADAKRAASICGLKLVSTNEFELPDSFGSRVIYTYKKVAKPKIKLPRQVGFAKHRPL